MKEQGKKKNPNEAEINKLLDKEFKASVIRTLTETWGKNR